MYSAEDKRRAVELFIKYDLSCASVINELGYPSRGSLYEWYRSYLEYGDSAFESNGYRRYTDRQKRAAVDYFFDHGKCIARTIRALGYPRSKELLASWIDEGNRKTIHRGSGQQRGRRARSSQASCCRNRGGARRREGYTLPMEETPIGRGGALQDAKGRR